MICLIDMLGTMLGSMLEMVHKAETPYPIHVYGIWMSLIDI